MSTHTDRGTERPTSHRPEGLDRDEDRLEPARGGERRPGELTARELLRFSWRQLTSMRTALLLLLLLAVAAVPGSVIPQQGVDSLKTSQWKEAHTSLAPIYERLGLFDVYGSPWFGAIYLLLMVSLVGCIVPRCLVYARALRAQPPPAPRHLTRLPDHATYASTAAPEAVLDKARAVLADRGYRLRAVDPDAPADAVSAERGYLREAGNLVFHLAVIVVLVGFAAGSLLGFKGGVILVQGDTFSNSLTQYDDFAPGGLYTSADQTPFRLKVDDFTVKWIYPDGQSMGTGFDAKVSYAGAPGEPEQQGDLRVNHPLDIGGTEVFLIGHGYAPVITVRDGKGDVVYRGPTVFLPLDSTFQSFGVVKAPDAQPKGIGLQGLLYPTFKLQDGNPISASGDDLDPLLSMLVYVGDLGMDSGASQSVYSLDTANATKLTKPDGRDLRLDMKPGQTKTLPDGLGSVTFDGIKPWTKLQISRTPGKLVALAGVLLALLGLIGSLFIRPRRVWVRARSEGGRTLVEVAVLDRSGGGEPRAVLEGLLDDLDAGADAPDEHDPHDPQDEQPHETPQPASQQTGESR